MGVEIFGLAFDALDPEAQARFWAGVLERDIDENGVKLLPRDDREFPIYFEKTDVPRPGPNQMHFDLMTSSWDDQKETVERALAQLPQHYASVLLLRHYQGLSLAETAQALDISENAAKLRLFRARKAFAAVYGGPAAGEEPDGESEDDR